MRGAVVILVVLCTWQGGLHGNTAEEVLSDQVTLQGVTATQPRRPDGGFDWDWRGPRDDPEWAWFFNRHDWFGPLLEAYRESGEDRYAEFVLAALDDWIATHPPPRWPTISSSWRPLEAARRILGTWPEVEGTLGGHPLFTAERRERFLESVRAHGWHLRRWHVNFGNHMVTEVLALTRIALMFPQFDESSAWLEYGLELLDRAYTDQVYPDGAQKELSTHYQRVVALNFQLLADTLRDHGKEEKGQQWQERVDLMWAYLAGVAKPDGSNPVNNDSDYEDINALLRAHAPQMLGQATETRVFDWAGQAVMRSRDAAGRLLWGWFDAGPRGIDHSHHDPLQVSLSLDTVHFLVDNGRYTYAPGPLRRYFEGPEGHNTVLLDGVGADAGPLQVSSGGNQLQHAVIEAAEVEIFSGRRSFALGGNRRAADWRRTVLHLRGRGWIVVDHLIQFKAREIMTLWHWDASAEPLQTEAASKFVVENAGQRLSVELISDTAVEAIAWQRGQMEPRPQGWTSRFFNQREPAWATLATQRITGPVLNAWLMLPADSVQEVRVEVMPDAKGLRLVMNETGEWHWDPRQPMQLSRAGDRTGEVAP